MGDMNRIREEQIQQGFEPCFSTTRLFQEQWVIDNCVKCTHRPQCIRDVHATIVSIHAGTSALPFGEQKRIMDEARSSAVVKKVTALAEAEIAGARAGEQLNTNLKKKGKRNVTKKDH